MIKKIKKLFGTQEEVVSDPPGRTFKKVLTGDYFDSGKKDADAATIAKSKQDKIDQIETLELLPKFVRFTYEKEKLSAAHVAFQKEVFARKWNMIHITEISFTVKASDFDEFEKMAGVSLKNDFKDLTEVHYNGEERRQSQRTS
ncbi:MAG TPA: hypothetical protein ENJ71_02070 [Epsilonproteobacteria bacterium]|nr:hypothetical protein [Campylobacterota bacterium]